MTLLDLIARVRRQLADEGGDTGLPPAGFSYYWEAYDESCLWSNAELTHYANAACTELAHRVPIVDSGTTAVTRITVTSGVASYTIDPRVLAIDAAQLASADEPLVKIYDATARSQWGDPNENVTDGLTEVKFYRDDFDRLALTLYATPSASDTLVLTVRRLPLTALAWATRTIDEPEFPAHIQEALLEWMASLALLQRDSDAQNIEASGYHQGRFSDMVGPRISFRLAQIHQAVAGKRLRTRATYY